MQKSPFIIIASTDPESNKGGIAYAMHGFFSALNEKKIPYRYIVTHYNGSIIGKWYPFLKILPTLISTIQHLRKRKFYVIVYSHAGQGISLLRKSIILYIAHLYGAKTVLHLHAADTDNYLKNPLKRWLFRRAIWPADQLCVLTAWWNTRFCEAGIKKKLQSSLIHYLRI